MRRNHIVFTTVIIHVVFLSTYFGIPFELDNNNNLTNDFLNPNFSEEILEFFGSSEEIGKAHGIQLKREIEANINNYWGKVLELGYSKEEAIQYIKSREENLPLHMITELKSLAKAANIKYEEILLLNLFPERLFKEEDNGCTSWIAAGTATQNGNTLLHKNRDMPVNPQVVVRMHSKGKYEYITILSAGQLSTAPTGINEHGLAAIQNDIALNPLNYNPLGVEGTAFTRSILEECKNVDEAIDYIKDNPCLGGTIFMVADHKKGAIIERSGWEYEVEIVEDEVEFRSNHFLKLKDITYENPAPSLTSARRYADAKDFFKDRQENLTVTDFNELSRHHYNPSKDEISEHDSGDGSICNYHTLSGTTYEIDKNYPKTLSVLWAAIGHPCSSIYAPIHLGSTEIYKKFENEKTWELAMNIFDNNLGPHEGLTPYFLEIEKEMIDSESIVRNNAYNYLELDDKKQAEEILTDFDLDKGEYVYDKMEDFAEENFWIDSFESDYYVKESDNLDVDFNVTLSEGNIIGSLKSIQIETEEEGWEDATFYAKLVIPDGTNITLKIIDSDTDEVLSEFVQASGTVEMDLKEIDSEKIYLYAELKTNNTLISPVLREWGIIGLNEIPVEESWIGPTEIYIIIVIISFIAVVIIILKRRVQNIKKARENLKESVPETSEQQIEYARTSTRIGAWFIDIILIGGFIFLAYLISLSFVFFNPLSIQIAIIPTWIVLITVLFLTGILYFGILEILTKGQTLGKKLLKLKTVEEHSKRVPTRGRLMINALFQGNPFIIFDILIGLIKNAGKEKKQFRLSQDLARVIVIKQRA